MESHHTGASPPSGVTAVQDGPTSIRVSWTPPSPLGDTTGYRIYYTRAGGSSDSVDVDGGNTVRVCVYCAVSGSSNTVSAPSVTVMESLVQVTVVAGPPVEIQVRVIWSESNVTSPDIVMSPVLIQF